MSRNEGWEAEDRPLSALSPAGCRLLDVRRTDLHSRFYDMFLYDLASELLDDIRRLPVDANTFALSRDARRYGYSGWVYWLIYLKGYTQYRTCGAVAESNAYYMYVVSNEASAADPTLSASVSPSSLAHRISRRFTDCDEFSEPASGSRFAEEVVRPITVFTRVRRAEDDLLGIYPEGSTDPIWARLVDGHHRLFAARLFGIKRIRFTVLVEAESVPEVPGHIEHISRVGERLQISGWLEVMGFAAQAIEVRSAGRAVCRAPLSSDRLIVSADAAFASRRRYAFSVEANLPGANAFDLLEIVLLSDWLPVGRLVVRPEHL